GELVSDYRFFQGDGFSAGVGFGIRIQLPIAPVPLGIDFGWPLFDQPGNQKQVVAINLNLQI
ncbi:MAG: BamA/TamA family outer membrane protein, partial [Planctomycetes bacterium]|nr:BamA/TamA family outer membrane protein [Planctomycetota bacterium]